MVSGIVVEITSVKVVTKNQLADVQNFCLLFVIVDGALLYKLINLIKFNHKFNYLRMGTRLSYGIGRSGRRGFS